MKEDVLETIYNYLITIASKRYRDIIREVVKVELASEVVEKIRVIFVDNSFLDIYWSSSGRYSLHYERRLFLLGGGRRRLRLGKSTFSMLLRA